VELAFHYFGYVKQAHGQCYTSVLICVHSVQLGWTIVDLNSSSLPSKPGLNPFSQFLCGCGYTL